MKYNFLIYILIISLFSCNTKEKKQIEINEKITVEKPENKPVDERLEKKHCYIKELYEQNGKKYIKADYVEFLFDEKAIEKAKENGDADYDISESGDTIYFVYNDYYVSNKNPKIRILEIDKNAKIEILDFSTTDNYRELLNVNDFKKEIEKNRIMILEMKNGIVMKMIEQYTP